MEIKFVSSIINRVLKRELSSGDIFSSGKWLPEEEKRLCDAVYELSGIKQGIGYVYSGS